MYRRYVQLQLVHLLESTRNEPVAVGPSKSSVDAVLLAEWVRLPVLNFLSIFLAFVRDGRLPSCTARSIWTSGRDGRTRLNKLGMRLTRLNKLGIFLSVGSSGEVIGGMLNSYCYLCLFNVLNEEELKV